MVSKYHQTVLEKEAVDYLNVRSEKNYVDATLGNGGHAIGIAKMGGKVLGIDIDPKMILVSEERMHGLTGFKLIHGNFVDLDILVKKYNWQPVTGIILDLGVSNIHLKDLARGFSFENPEANLDMRLDPNSQAVTAADLVNVLRKDQLVDLFSTVLAEGASKWIASRVITARRAKTIKSVGDLLEICRGLRVRKSGMNEATLPFLALRIAVNSEIENLEQVLPKAYDILESTGRLVVISFHSKEDEIVKSFFTKIIKEGAKQITTGPILPGEAEVFENRRARSAKMRVIEKI